MSAAAAPRAFAPAAERTQSAAASEAASRLTRREATLRATATTCLTAVALIQALALPALLARSATLAALSLAAIVLCLGCGLALAAGTASASRKVWRAVAATGALVLAGWGLPHAVVLPAPAGARGDWAAMPGVACAGLAAASVLLAAAAVRSPRATAHGAAAALAVVIAFGPGAAAMLVATGPGPPGGETAIAADVHVHAQSIASERDILFRAGRTGNHYVTRVPTTPHPPAVGVALVVAMASIFVGAAVAHLRGRSRAPGPVT